MATGDGDPFAPTMAPAVAGVDLSPVESMATVAAGGSPGPGDGRSRLPEVPLGHFRAERELARGGMGKIVAADDIRLGRPVALKVLLEPTGDAIGRFEREALITARLQHPGIVPVYEAGRWPGGEPFFAMKLVQGRPLDKVIAEATTLEARLALLPRVAAATDAIAYAHSQRIIHRDLKPANVLIGDFGETVVIDWGLAKSLDDAETSADRHPTRSLRPSAVMTSQPGATPNSNASTLTVAGAVMGIMLIPFVSSLSDDIINAVPQSLRDGSYAMGAFAWWAGHSRHSGKLLALLAAAGCAALLWDFRLRIALALVVALGLGVARWQLGHDTNQKPVLKPVALRLLRILSRSSYALFLTHFSIVLLSNVLWARFAWTVPGAAAWVAAAAWIVCVVVSMLFERFVERPLSVIRIPA